MCHVSLTCVSTNAGGRIFAARLSVVLKKEVWIMISSPSVGRKKIHFPAFPDGLCGDCGREARQAVDGLSAGHAAEFRLM